MTAGLAATAANTGHGCPEQKRGFALRDWGSSPGCQEGSGPGLSSSAAGAMPQTPRRADAVSMPIWWI